MSALPPERWAEVKALFHEAAALDPALRGPWLERAAPEDPELRAQVVSLLAHHDAADLFLETPAAAPEPGLGQAFGPYRVLRVLGHGGMGAVYLAERADRQFEKTVAVKCIHRGLDTELTRERFLRERQILADLDHPHIARFLDGGTTPEGLAYLVMEHVDGLPIDAYCASRRLDLRARLELFRGVCAAVHFAHQRLVIHRDLKPGNILVTAEGVPKLLDFGIAKLLDGERPEATATGAALMTPEFASPEQVRGEPLSTVSDVYSLGVLLYLLASGCRPYRFDTRAPEEILRRVCLEDPPRPSEAARAAGGAEAGSLVGDLDTIVLRALQKEPGRRYGSAAELSEDLRRHLEGLPVLARPDTLGYRVSKFLGRNRKAAWAAGLALAALAAGAGIAVREARVARVERSKAERRFQEVRRLSEAFLFEFHDALQDVPGTFRARHLVLQRAREYLDSLAADGGDDLGLQDELATAYARLAHVSERAPEVISAQRKALAIGQRLAARAPGNVGFQRSLAIHHSELAGQLRMYGDTAGALAHAREAARILGTARPASEDWTSDRVTAESELGLSLQAAGLPEEALVHLREALALAETRGTAAGPDARQDLIVAEALVGNLLREQGRPVEALADFRKAFEHVSEGLKTTPRHSVLLRDQCVLHRRMGEALAGTGERAQALQEFRKALDLLAAMMAADPTDEGHRRQLAALHLDLGDVLAAEGRPGEALARYQRSVDVCAAVAAEDPERMETRQDLALALLRMGTLRLRLHQEGPARSELRRALALYEALHRTDPGNAAVSKGLEETRTRLG